MAVSATERPAQIVDGDMVFEPWIGNEAIRARTAAMAGYLATKFSGKHVRLLPVLNGAIPFNNMLLDALRTAKHPLHIVAVDPIQVKSYAGTTSQDLVWKKRPGLESDSHVHDILVEDICDSGRTLSVVEEYLRNQEPASLTTAVLLNRPEARANNHTSYQPTIAGFEIADPDAWAIGFGLDLDGQYRELQHIYGKVVDGESPAPYSLPPFPEIQQ
jgi:hypoxanthine phosphoribosyltransferase